MPTKSGQLGASFFFKSSQGNPGNTSRFFTTLAAQLARSKPFIRQRIKKNLDLDPYLADKGPDEQFEKPLYQPIIACGPELVSRLLLAVNTLDESDGDWHIKLIVRLLLEHKKLKM